MLTTKQKVTLIIYFSVIIAMFVIVFMNDPMGKTGSIIPEGYGM